LPSSALPNIDVRLPPEGSCRELVAKRVLGRDRTGAFAAGQAGRAPADAAWDAPVRTLPPRDENGRRSATVVD
jgi:hypothetical protein